MELLIVSGISGAGKSLAVNALEDIGFFCIDNIPAGLLPKLVELAQSSTELEKVAVVLDIRAGKSMTGIIETLSSLDKNDVSFKVLFLDASDETLERRYKETRRRHPISISDGVSTAQAIKAEREVLTPICELANFKIDTSLLSTAMLRDKIVSLFMAQTADAMRLNILSFGFKYGQPKEADIIFDVRCIPNPFYIPELKHKTGMDKEVYDFVFKNEGAEGLYKRIFELLTYSLPLYVKEGKSQLTIAVGCTGGKHRSIAFVQRLLKDLSPLGFKPHVENRDFDRFY